MRTKDIKKIIKSEIESHIPKSAPKIDFPFVVPQVKPERKIKPFFKWQYAMTLALSVFLIVIVLSMLGESPVTPTPNNQLLSTDNEVISFSAVSSVSLMTTFGINDQIAWTQTPLLVTETEPPIISHVMPYLKSVEQLLSSERGLNILTGASELPDYEFFMQFETRDLLGTTTQYIMHYNMLLVDVDDDEMEYELEGVLMFGNQIFDVTGEKKIEDDEEKVRFKAFKDDNNYVASEYKIENDEQVFEFSVVQHGQTISMSRFEIEFDDEETKVQLSFEEGDDEGAFEFEYFTEDGINFIAIEFETEIDGISTSGEMTVQLIEDPITGAIRYRMVIDPDDDDPYEYEREKDDDDDEESEPSEPEETDEEDEEDPEEDDSEEDPEEEDDPEEDESDL